MIAGVFGGVAGAGFTGARAEDADALAGGSVLLEVAGAESFAGGCAGSAAALAGGTLGFASVFGCFGEAVSETIPTSRSSVTTPPPIQIHGVGRLRLIWPI